MADSPGPEWWRTLPPAQTEIRCSHSRHVIRWEDGSITLPAHDDAEAELVLAALGGKKAACLEVAEVWGRHTGDLDALTLGPRSAADEVLTSWDDVEAARSGRPARPPVRPQSVPMRPAALPGALRPGRGVSRPAAADDAWARQIELLSLLALGPAFQLRLAATVASLRDTAATGPRSVLTAALTGRLAPAAAAWLGIDAGRVVAYPHEGPGWGSVEATGPGTGSLGTGPGLRASLPMDWLARVWAAGLAVTGGHLVVAVQAARWPDARVLALAEPGTAPVVLGVRAVVPEQPADGGPEQPADGGPEQPADGGPEQPADGGPEQPADGAHWVVTNTGREADRT